jgi:Putative peptidoglycan-binding domain-containing protein
LAIGKLIINVYADNEGQPVDKAVVTVTGDNYNKEYETDSSGKVYIDQLYAPEKEYSEVPQKEIRPYSIYDVSVKKDGLQTTTVNNVEILPDETSIQNIYMSSKITKEEPEKIINLPEHNLWGEYPPKLPEEPIKFEENETRVLTKVFIPEYIIVHAGLPTNSSASNYYVSFPDYIKNVASSEIYSTWPRETIKANVHAIASFTMNRIFTEWYRGRGYNFTITGVPQYDQTYTHGRTIFKSIADIVDEVFNTYIKLPNVKQPFFAQYNDGIKTNNKGWLSQWGSKDLGDRGYTAINILKHYYTNSLTLEKGVEIEGLPTSFPGYNLKLGSCGEPVQKIQNEINKINGSYPGIPKLAYADGIYGENTKKSVETFQKVFDLPVTGVVDFSTWYKISYIFVAVSKMIAGITNN